MNFEFIVQGNSDEIEEIINFLIDEKDEEEIAELLYKCYDKNESDETELYFRCKNKKIDSEIDAEQCIRLLSEINCNVKIIGKYISDNCITHYKSDLGTYDIEIHIDENEDDIF